MCPLLSLFRREENRDGDTYVPFALHNYGSTATLLIVRLPTTVTPRTISDSFRTSQLAQTGLFHQKQVKFNC